MSGNSEERPLLVGFPSQGHDGDSELFRSGESIEVSPRSADVEATFEHNSGQAENTERVESNSDPNPSRSVQNPADAPSPTYPPRPLTLDSENSGLMPRIGSGLESIPELHDIGDTKIWSKYVSESTEYDTQLIAEWNSGLDVLLIFAGLFSAILTAFIVEFYRFLGPNTDEITAKTLLDISLLLRANAQNQSLPEPSIHPEEVFDFTTPDALLWVNALWFSSLALSLGAAVAVMVVKQWLQSYTAAQNSGDHHFDALRRQLRFNSFHNWRVPLIISILPLMMHFSVALFLAGLTIQLWQLSKVMAIVFVTFVSALATVYIITLLLPIFRPSCPYKTSGLVLLQRSFHHGNVIFWWLSYHIVRFLSHSDDHSKKSNSPSTNKALEEVLEKRLDEAKIVRNQDWEPKTVKAREECLNLESVLWLIRASGRQEVVDQGLISISELKPSPKFAKLCLKNIIPGLLVGRAYYPLPDREHDNWKLPKPETFWPPGRLRQVDNMVPYLISLMSIWHNEDYFSEHPPSPISYSNVLGCPAHLRSVQSASFPKHKTQAGNSLLSHPSDAAACLLGDWLYLWRQLKHRRQSDNEDMSEYWNINTFAFIVCAEAHYEHINYLRRHKVKEFMPHPGDSQTNDISLDICDLLDDETAPRTSELEDPALERILDTVIYLISNREEEKHSQHPLFSLEMLSLLLKLLKTRLDNHDEVLVKLQMALSIFTIKGKNRRQEAKKYFQTGSYGALERKKTYIGLAHILKEIIKEQLNSLEAGPYVPPSLLKLKSSIIESATIHLFNSHLNLNTPPQEFNTFFFGLPSVYAEKVIDLISNLFHPTERYYEWKSERTCKWVIQLLCDWCNVSTLSMDLKLSIIRIQSSMLNLNWRKDPLSLNAICQLILDAWKQYLQSNDSTLANTTSIEACRALKSMFDHNQRHTGDERPPNDPIQHDDGQQHTKDKPLLNEFIQREGLIEAICDFLKGEYASPKAKEYWGQVLNRWKEDKLEDKGKDMFERLQQQVLPLDTPYLSVPDLTPNRGGEAVILLPDPTEATVSLSP